MIFSLGCQAVWSIFLLKSRLSTLISSFFRLPLAQTLRGFRTVRGLLFSRDASRVMSRFVFLSNILKKLLYDPVMTTLQKQTRMQSNTWTEAYVQWNDSGMNLARCAPQETVIQAEFDLRRGLLTPTQRPSNKPVLVWYQLGLVNLVFSQRPLFMTAQTITNEGSILKYSCLAV